jgi:uncharacterized protein (TIGR03663 family)
MNRTAARGPFALVLVLAFAGALVFRVADLDIRPMHHDEANQALKFGLLLERGEYRYDPADHHGPTLYYLSLPVARLLGRDSLASLDERSLRLLPAVFGAALILVLGLFLTELGAGAVLAAGVLAAVSPAFVYYSRFYIQETILVFFAAAFLGALWKFRRKRSVGWAAAAGISAGLMFATKETSLILFAAAGAALAVAGRAGKAAARERNKDPRPVFIPAAVGVAAAVLTSILFYSSFLTYPRGILDSILAFGDYFAKSGSAGFHAHPAGTYLAILTFSASGGLVWSESLILALAFLGIIGVIRTKNAFGLYISIYALLTAAVFSAIRYKTPWNLLPFHFGFIVLAGIGTAYLFRSLKNVPVKIIAAALLLAGTIQLGSQAWAASFRYPADPRNPYAYAQTGTDYPKLVRRIEDIARIDPEGRRMLIKVVCDPTEMWPLPWSLRRFERVGYWTDAERAGGADGAAVIIASPNQAARLEPLLKESYDSEYYGLRPDVPLTVYIRRDLWNRFINTKK